jgi:arylamine N-acetyltransferase
MSLDAYLARIGVAPAPADLATLRAIVTGHTRAIAFENLNPFTGREVDLDDDALAAKIVHGGRGGYCFEQNLVLRRALDDLGYRTTMLTGRVVWGRPADAPPLPRTHMLLRVDLPEAPYVVDVGFGGQTLTGVLRMEHGVQQATPHEPYRLLAETCSQGRADSAGTWTMQARVGAEWRSLYHFDLAPQLRADLEMASWYVSHHPESHFVTGVVAARPAPDRRYNLGGRILATHHLGGPSESTELASATAIMDVLEETFLLTLAALPDLEPALKRLF